MQNLFALIGALALSTTGSAAVVFLNAFDAGSAADAGYYRFGTTDTTLDVAGGTLNYTYSSSATNRSGVIKQFDNTTLEVGESLTFAFTIVIRTLRDDENNSFRWSIGNIGSTVNADLASAEPFSGGARRNYVFAAATGSAATALNQHSAGFSSPVNGGTTTPVSGLDASNFAASSGDAFSISMAFTRTAAGLDIEKDFGGVISSGSFATSDANDFVFNTIAFSFNNAGDYNISLDDISVSVIPEPSAYAALAGFLAFTFVIVRRRLRDSREQ